MKHWSVSQQAAILHTDALVWDNHICLQHENDDRFMPEIQRYVDSGVNMVVVSVGFDVLPWEQTFRVLAVMRHWLLARTESFILARTADDVVRAKQEGKLAVAFNIEGMNAIQDQLSLIQLYYDLGVRWMSIAYNLNNKAGGGCHDKDMGLSEFGRQIIDEMKRVGIVACCTHTGYKTARDVLEYSQNPVIFSHSNPRALVDHQRNIPDELMKACAVTGGVVGINGIGLFLGDELVSPDTMVRHIDYAVQLIGASHVSVGLDFSVDSTTCALDLTKPSDKLPQHFYKYFPPGNGYESGVTIVQPEQIPRITEGLMKLHYSEADIRCILGENLLRIARKVWR